MEKFYEIHDLTTNEILADNLFFDEVPELFEAYESFYFNHKIAVFHRLDGYIKSNKYLNIGLQKQQEFKTEWFNLIEANLCNIY